MKSRFLLLAAWVAWLAACTTVRAISYEQAIRN